jgi:hypothetical protein
VKSKEGGIGIPAGDVGRDETSKSESKRSRMRWKIESQESLLLHSSDESEHFDNLSAKAKGIRRESVSNPPVVVEEGTSI